MNLLACGLYYVCQAAGVVSPPAFSPAPRYCKRARTAFYTSIAMVACLGIAVFSPSAGVVIAAGTLLNLMIGVLSALYLTRLSTDVPQQRRGLVFGVAYAFGSIGTWILSLPMDGKFLWSSESFFAIAALAAASLLLVRRLSPLSEQEHEARPLRTGFSKKLIWLAAAVVFLIWLKNTLGFSFPLESASGSVYIEFTRMFYVGLIIAGLVSVRTGVGVYMLLGHRAPLRRWLGGIMAAEPVWILAYLFLAFWRHTACLFLRIFQRRWHCPRWPRWALWRDGSGRRWVRLM